MLYYNVNHKQSQQFNMCAVKPIELKDLPPKLKSVELALELFLSRLMHVCENWAAFGDEAVIHPNCWYSPVRVFSFILRVSAIPSFSPLCCSVTCSLASVIPHLMVQQTPLRKQGIHSISVLQLKELTYTKVAQHY